MAGGAGLGVLPPECSGIEARTVRIEAPASQRRVAGKTVSLGMAGDAAFQVLARGLSMIEEEGLLRIMKADAPEPAGGGESRADMAVGAELGLVVALTARAFPTKRCGGMRRQEAGRMVPRRCIGRAGTMALETGRPGMAGGAALRPRGSGSSVALGEVQAMGFRPPTLDVSSLATARCRSRDGLDAGRGGCVAGQTTLLSVTSRAVGRRFTDLPSMPAKERRVVMARRSFELRPHRQRAWIWSERLDGWHLRRVHMALGAEVLGMTSGAGSGDRACGTRQLSMQRGVESGFTMGRRSRKVPY